MDELSLDNILSEDQINGLFSNEEIQETEEPKHNPEEEEGKKKDGSPEEETIETTEANLGELFGSEEKPEGVGSEEETKEKKDTTSTGGSSSNFYSSIANALVEDGILQNLDEKELAKIQTAEDFAEAISNQIKNQLDEKQKRVSEALDLGIGPTEIQKYERYISILDGVTEEGLTSEGEEGENLRKNLIYQDCLNKGYSKERALKMVDKSIKAGTDIEDAREALNDNKEFYKKQYNSMLDEAREAEKEEQKKFKQQADELRNSILEEDTAFGDVKIDKSTRQRVYDSIMKPIYTDPESGEKLTAVQKYELEHRTDFLKNVGLLFVLTDGFKNIDRLVTDKVKKETKKSLRNLEHTLSGGGSGFRGGNLSFANNSGDTDPESLFKGWKLSV
jgi:hypothetical protein